MVVNLTGTIELGGLDDIEMKSIKNTIKNSGIDASIRSDVIFINTDIDNSENYVESLAYYLAEVLPASTETTLTVKAVNGLDVTGDNLDGYYDIIISNQKCYAMAYKILKSIKTELCVEVK